MANKQGSLARPRPLSHTASNISPPTVWRLKCTCSGRGAVLSGVIEQIIHYVTKFFFGEGQRWSIGNVHLQVATGGPQLRHQVEAHIGNDGQHINRCGSLRLIFCTLITAVRCSMIRWTQSTESCIILKITGTWAAAWLRAAAPPALGASLRYWCEAVHTKLWRSSFMRVSCSLLAYN